MLGPLVLFVSTLMHPLEADPNDAVTAFTEYAADRLWVGTHLGQFLGVAIIVAALVMLSRSLEEGKAAAWSRIGLAGAIAFKQAERLANLLERLTVSTAKLARKRLGATIPVQ